jgi:Tol biopolymer transport system component
MNLDGSNQQPLYLADAGTMEQFFPEFSADGKSIAFESETLAAAANAKPHHKGVRASSWTDHKLQSRAKAHGSAAPALSTNGIYTMHLTDATPTLAYETTNWAGPAVFSGDGSKLLLTLWGDGDFMNISSVNLDGTALTPLTTNPDTDSFAPVPYKNLIIFNRANNDTSSWDIYAMDQSGGNQALVHSTADTDESLNDAFWD